MINLILNREIAYQGALGRYRENSCINYIKLKKTTFKDIEDKIIKTATANGRTISCHKGCSYCCSQTVGVSIEEAETIVYYLYKHEEALSNFTENYPVWREKVGENESLLCNIYRTFIETGNRTNKQASLDIAAKLYLDLNIPCPFLINKTCSIYEVRPWGCAIGMSTSPPEYCIGKSKNHPVMIIVNPWREVLSVFFYNELHNEVYLPLPIVVNEILSGGTNYLSKFPGLENIHREHIKDPIVQSIIRKYVGF